MLNKNLVLGALVAVVFIATGAVMAILLAGGSEEAQLARAGILTAMLGPTIAALLALLSQSSTNHNVSTLNGTVNGHSDQLEAAEAKIAYLQAKTGVTGPPPVGPSGGTE